jgi:hypothetical protein
MQIRFPSATWLLYELDKSPWVRLPAVKEGTSISQVGVQLPIGAILNKVRRLRAWLLNSPVCRAVAVAPVVLFALFALAEPLRASNIPALGSQCHSGKQKACDELAKIATEDKHPDRRSEAVSQLNDQSLLEKIALQDSAADVCDEAVSMLTDQAALGRVAIAETVKDIAQEALNKVTDPSWLFQAALEAKVFEIRTAAADKLEDPLLLSRIALESTDTTIGVRAIKKLSDQSLLGKIATQAKDSAVRTAAVWKLTDRVLLAKVAADDPDEDVRKAASAAEDWKTAQAEREVYVWKAPTPDASGAPLPRWRISGILGAADLGEDISNSDSSQTLGSLAMGVGSLLESSINPEAAGFSPWSFKPENDQDVCDLESGYLSFLDSDGNQKRIPAPISFKGHVANGKGMWGMSDGKSVVLFRPTLHIDQKGTLAIGGAWAGYTPGTGTGSFSSSTIQDAVIVVGTIRFPKDELNQAGAGLEIMGGGLQFDETGVFLMPGTQYRKVAH